MALGIRQQIKSAVQRARDYWADLSDASDKRARSEREEREDAVHQRYGGERSPGGREAETRLRERQEESQDRGRPDAVMANPAARAARSGQGGQPGGQSRLDNPMQGGQARMQAGRNEAGAGEGQSASRQYTQQGGSGLEKPPRGQQPGDDRSRGAPRGRGSNGQRS